MNWERYGLCSYPRRNSSILISFLLNLDDTLHNLVIIYTFLFPLNYYLDKVSHWRNILYTNVFALSFGCCVFAFYLYFIEYSSYNTFSIYAGSLCCSCVFNLYYFSATKRMFLTFIFVKALLSWLNLHEINSLTQIRSIASKQVGPNEQVVL